MISTLFEESQAEAAETIEPRDEFSEDAISFRGISAFSWASPTANHTSQRVYQTTFPSAAMFHLEFCYTQSFWARAVNNAPRRLLRILGSAAIDDFRNFNRQRFIASRSFFKEPVPDRRSDPRRPQVLLKAGKHHHQHRHDSFQVAPLPI